MNEKKLVLASHNAKKTRELRAILEPAGYVLLNLTDFPGAPEPEETGRTFEENAVIKAESAHKHTGLPSLADDSGLEVDALGGRPGVYSARFAGEDAGDAANNALLLEELAQVPDDKRTARFVSVIAFAVSGKTPRTFRGETSGVVLREARGGGGFGYDPLFLSDDLQMTFAEAPVAEKNRISHRGRAITALMHALGNPIFV